MEPALFARLRVGQRMTGTVSEQLQLEDEEVPITLRRAWDRALRLLANRVNKPTFEAHIRSIRPMGMSEESRSAGSTAFAVTLGVPSAFTREWVEKRHSGLIQGILEEILDGAVTVSFALLPKERDAAAQTNTGSGDLFSGTAVAASPAPPTAPSTAERSSGRKPAPTRTTGARRVPATAAATSEALFDFGPESAAPAGAVRAAAATGEAEVAPAPAGSAEVVPAAPGAAKPEPAAATALPAPAAPPAAPSTPRPAVSTGGNSSSKGSDAPLLHPRYTFDAFVTGPTNRLACAGARAVADAPGRVYNPLFLYGPSGLGKTHLMHAIGHEYLQRHGGDPRGIAYISGESFTSLFVTSIRDRKAEEFRRRWRSVDLWLVDDIQFIAGKEGTKEEFFHTFNALYQSGKQIVICSDRSPRELQAMDERLRSRFECGLIADIAPPDLETRLAILHKKAEAEGMRIPDEVLLYMARLVQSNIRTLEGALVKLIAYASVVKSPVTTELASSILERYYIVPGSGGSSDGRPREGGAATGTGAEGARTFSGSWPEGARGPFERPHRAGQWGSGGNSAFALGGAVTPEAVQRVVAKRFGLTPEALSGKRRDREAVSARQIAMHLMRELTEMSLPGIGSLFGRDHTTVLHSCDKVRSQIPMDEDLRSLVEDLTEQIRMQAAGN